MVGGGDNLDKKIQGILIKVINFIYSKSANLKEANEAFTFIITSNENIYQRKLTEIMKLSE